MSLARELTTRLTPASQSSESLLALVAPAPDTPDAPDASGHAGAPAGAASTPPVAVVRALERARISAPRDCYVCGNPRIDAVRFCESCGATMSIVVPGTTVEQSAAARLAAVRAVTGRQLPIIGEMPSSDGGTIYFAREPHADSVLLALVPEVVVRGAATPLVLDAMPAMQAIQPSLPAPPPEPGVDAAAAPVAHPTPPDTIAVAEDPLVGSLIDGKYRILRLLGQGGMGRVFDARHEQLRGRRAIKVMHPYLESRPDLVTRFYEEARNAERVNHEHVCTVHDFGNSNGLIYIAMEFIDGEALSALLKREGKISPARASVIVAQTAAALDAAHALKIIHRDVKPDNIMLCRHVDGRDDVKVVDFGISKALNRSELTSGGVDTQFGVVIGTLDYMSHEQRFGLDVDPRTDIYALARTTVKMLFGELPEHAAWKEWSKTHVKPPLLAVLDGGLAPLEQRYASAGEFSRDLTRVLAEGVSPTPWWEKLVQYFKQKWNQVWLRPRLALSVAAMATVLIALLFALPAIRGANTDDSERDPRVEPPIVLPREIAITASPSAVNFEAESGATAPPPQVVQIRSTSGDSVAGLGIDDVQYEGSTSGWLARPTWRGGNATAPTALVIEPRVGATPPGTYTAHVRVMSPTSGTVATSIITTLVVKPAAIRPVDDCAASRAQLARIRRLTDPVAGTTDGARRVVALMPSLLPNLCLPSERVEAQFRLAEAYISLSQSERACGVLRRIEGPAASTPFAVNVELFLSRCR